jgi:hypothetical protein
MHRPQVHVPELPGARGAIAEYPGLAA